MINLALIPPPKSLSFQEQQELKELGEYIFKSVGVLRITEEDMERPEVQRYAQLAKRKKAWLEFQMELRKNIICN